MKAQPGFSTVEQIVVMTILAITVAIAIPASVPLINAAAVESASQQTTALFALARDYAITSGSPTAVRIDQPAQRLTVHSGKDTIAQTSFANSHIRVRASRDSMAYAPTGLGSGAANLQISLSLANSADTITVSRLGRVSRRR